MTLVHISIDRQRRDHVPGALGQHEGLIGRLDRLGGVLLQPVDLHGCVEVPRVLAQHRLEGAQRGGVVPPLQLLQPLDEDRILGKDGGPVLRGGLEPPVHPDQAHHQGHRSPHDKAPHVGRVGHRLGVVALGGQAEELPDQPERHGPVGLHLPYAIDRAEHHHDEVADADLGLVVGDQEGPHGRGDGPGGAYQRALAARVHAAPGQRGGHAAAQVERQPDDPPPAVLHVAAAEIEEQHVHDQVQPAPVHEHVAHQGPGLGALGVAAGVEQPGGALDLGDEGLHPLVVRVGLGHHLARLEVLEELADPAVVAHHRLPDREVGLRVLELFGVLLLDPPVAVLPEQLLDRKLLLLHEQLRLVLVHRVEGVVDLEDQTEGDDTHRHPGEAEDPFVMPQWQKDHHKLMIVEDGSRRLK